MIEYKLRIKDILYKEYILKKEIKKAIKKGRLHKKNIHQGRYDLKLLSKKSNELREYIITNPRGEETIDFHNPKAVFALNKALLKTYYNIAYYDIPEGFLCPPIPGRADYIHYLAEKVDYKNKLSVLDIGTGANCIYPIIGINTYKWSFLGTDIDPKSINNGNKLIEKNNVLKGRFQVKLQKNKANIFRGIIGETDKFYYTMCNPPFHKSLHDAIEANKRKNTNLSKGKNKDENLNFGGQKAELWCKGGELAFIDKMINESKEFRDNVVWFTTLVSNKENLVSLKETLSKVGAKRVEVIEMSQGQKISRILLWSFMEK